MQNATAHVALQTIDVIVYQSSHKELSHDELEELRGACGTLTQCVEGNGDIATKAASLVRLIQSAFLESGSRAGAARDEILKAGITLSIYIHRLSDSNPGGGVKS